MLIYRLPGNFQTLIISGQVIKYLNKFRQIKIRQKEAGGQLFAKITDKIVSVETATGPHKKDYRRRYHFFPNQIRLRSEIKTYFRQGLHYVGDWHTHPQKNPSPSSLDIESMYRCFRQSKHELDHFILIIVGQKAEDENLWVGIINSKSLLKIEPYRSQHH